MASSERDDGATTAGHWETLGLKLAYRAWGRPGDPTLLLLHGLLDTGSAHGRLARHLAAEGLYVVAPDQRGHGESDHVGPGGYYHFADYVLDLDGLYRHLGVETAIMAGHSMGAAVAAYFAGAYPERVRGLILLDAIGPPGGTDPAGAPARWRRWIDDVRRRENHVEKGAPSLDAVAARIGRLSTRAPAEVLGELARAAAQQRPEDGRWVWRFDRLHRTQAPYGFDDQRFRAFLERITCPTLMLWAQQTGLRAAAAEARLEELSDVEVRTIPDTGHNLHHERPEAVAHAILDFLGDRGL